VSGQPPTIDPSARMYSACADLRIPIELLPEGKRMKLQGSKVQDVAFVGIPVNYQHGCLEVDGVDPTNQAFSREIALIAAAPVCKLVCERFPQYPIRNED